MEVRCYLSMISYKKFYCVEFSPFAFIKHLGFYPCLFQIHPASPYPRVLAQADGHPWISTPSPSRKGLSFPIREDSELVSSIVCLCSDHQLFLMSKIQPYSFRFTKPQLTHVGATAYSLRNVLHILKCIFLHTWEYTFIALPFPHDCNYINTNTFYTYFVLVIFSFQQSNSIALSFFDSLQQSISLSISHQKYFIIPLMMEAECYHFILLLQKYCTS